MNDLRTAAQQALEALVLMRGKYEEYACAACDSADSAITALRAALAEQVQEPVQEEVYWYVGTDGKYHSSNEVKLFMDAETKSLHLDPPQWRKDKGDLIPLYITPPQRKWTGLTEAERVDIIDAEITEQNSEHFALAQAIEAALKKKNA